MNTTASFQAANPQAEIIAVVLPDGTPEQPDALTDFVATGTMLLVRHADGRMALEPLKSRSGISRNTRPLAMGSSRKSRPIVDPVTREIMGYEMEVAAAACM